MEFSFCDIRSAYLQADLKIKQYMRPPPGFKPPTPGHVMRLDKALYGLKQSGREWATLFRKNLLAWGFTAATSDECLYIKWENGALMRILVFVDDLAIFHDNSDAGRKMKSDLIVSIEKEGYEYSSSDDDHVYLGMAVHRINDTCLFLTQERYVQDVAIKYGYENCAKTWAPSRGGSVTKRDCPHEPIGFDIDGGELDMVFLDPSLNKEGTRFREICGALRWVEQCTRPDISAVLSELSKVQSNPGPDHIDRLDHLMRYINTTKHFGLRYGGPKGEHADGILVGYTDSDWAGDVDTMYSRGGYLFTMFQGPVVWCSQKMHAVAASSCEAEFMAASRMVREGKWMRYLLSDLGYGDLTCRNYGKFCDRDFVKVRLSDLVDPSETPWTGMCDNKAAVALSKNAALHKRSKHGHLAYRITRREVKAGHCVFAYIPTGENIADLLTKGLNKATHRYLTSKIMSSMVDGVICDIMGDALDTGVNDRTGAANYEQIPLGLDPSRGDNMLPEHASLPTPLPEGDSEQVLVETSAPTGTASDASHSSNEQVVSGHLAKLLSMITREVKQLLSGEIRQEMSKILPESANTSGTLYDILDSGASRTYVKRGQKLHNTRESRATVSVANGHVEQVAEEGMMGPIIGAQKVNSFPRSLIAVMDLCEQFGKVVFDKSSAILVTDYRSGYALRTKIGAGTSERLFSFDMSALKRHAAQMNTLRAAGEVALHL